MAKIEAGLYVDLAPGIAALKSYLTHIQIFNVEANKLFKDLKAKPDFSAFEAESARLTKQLQGMAKETVKPKFDIEASLVKLKMSELKEMKKALEAEYQKALKLNANVGDIAKIKSQLDEVNGALKNIDTNGKTAFKGMELDGTIQKLTGIVAGLFGVQQALSFFKTSLSLSGEQEQFSTALKVMLGDAESAKTRLNEIINFAANTPFRVPEVVGMANKLEAMKRYSIDNMTMLGDLAAASTKPIEQVMNAYSKLVTGQKGIAIEMFRDLLIAQDDWVKATGKGFNKAGESLATTAELLAALPTIMANKNFNGMMTEQAKTMKGQFSNLQDAAEQLQVSIGDAFKPMAMDIMQVAIPALQGLKGNVDLIIGSVMVAGTAFVTYELVVNAAVIKTKLMWVATDILKLKLETLKTVFLTNPFVIFATAAITLYELNQAYGNTIEKQEKAIEASKKANAEMQKSIQTQIDAKLKTAGISDEYGKLYAKTLDMEKGSKEYAEAQKKLADILEESKTKHAGIADQYEKLYKQHEKAKPQSEERLKLEKQMHDILAEQQKLYPKLIPDTYNYALGVDAIKNASQTAVDEVHRLTGELNAQQIALAKIQKAATDLRLHQTVTKFEKDFTPSYLMATAKDALPEDAKKVKSLMSEFRAGTTSAENAIKTLETLESKYASWAAMGGKDQSYNYSFANSISEINKELREEIRLNDMIKTGKGATPQTKAETPKPKATETGTESEIQKILKREKELNDEIKQINKELEKKGLSEKQIYDLTKKRGELEKEQNEYKFALFNSEIQKRVQLHEIIRQGGELLKDSSKLTQDQIDAIHEGIRKAHKELFEMGIENARIKAGFGEASVIVSSPDKTLEGVTPIDKPVPGIKESQTELRAQLALTEGSIDGLQNGMDEMWSQWIIGSRQAANELDAVWLSIKNSFLQRIGEMLTSSLLDSFLNKISGKGGGGLGGLLSSFLGFIPGIGPALSAGVGIIEGGQSGSFEGTGGGSFAKPLINPFAGQNMINQMVEGYARSLATKNLANVALTMKMSQMQNQNYSRREENINVSIPPIEFRQKGADLQAITLKQTNKLKRYEY